MTDWNPEDPFDLGVWSDLRLPPPPGEKPERYVPLQLSIPPFLSCDPTKSPEVKRSRKSLKLNKPATLPNIDENDDPLQVALSNSTSNTSRFC